MSSAYHQWRIIKIEKCNRQFLIYITFELKKFFKSQYLLKLEHSTKQTNSPALYNYYKSTHSFLFKLCFIVSYYNDNGVKNHQQNSLLFFKI